jgi:hypothetical protein
MLIFIDLSTRHPSLKQPIKGFIIIIIIIIESSPNNLKNISKQAFSEQFKAPALQLHILEKKLR